ncbi:MAG: 5'-nucleotidase C-terminal domain-containing protein [Pseudorhodobacter sp.]|nr:5'-nucleotidase C-terminal domain-containing protein [Pseudorhodobacter sp.]
MSDDPKTRSSDRSGRLALLQINDTHGYLEPHPELVWDYEGATFSTMGGFARIKTVFEAVRAEAAGAVLAFDNGDTFHGTHAAVSSKGRALVPVLNALGLSAMTAHWDFAWGPDHVKELAGALHYPVLAANCWQKDEDSHPFQCTLMCEAGGLRVGVIGLAATILDKTMPPNFAAGLRFTDGIDETRAEAASLRAEGADLIVVLSHLGYPQDICLAESVSGLDVIISGHTHNRLEVPTEANGALIIQSGCHGSFVGRLDIEVQQGRIERFQHRLIPVDDSIEPDAATQVLVDRAMQASRAMQQIVVGQTAIALHRCTSLDSPMDDLLLAAIADAAGTAIAFSNGWRYGAPIRPGPITLHDLWNMIPTNPPVSVVDMSGAEIWEMIEKNLENTFSVEPFGQRGGYAKRFRGLTVNAKLENPKGRRVEAIFDTQGKISAAQIYPVAFVTAQGVPAHMGRNRCDLEILAIDALRAWLADPSHDARSGRGQLRIT